MFYGRCCLDLGPPGIILMTVHQSRGLRSPWLFLLVGAVVSYGLTFVTFGPWCATPTSEVEYYLLLYPRLAFLLGLGFWLIPMWGFAHVNIGVPWWVGLRALAPVALGAWSVHEFLNITPDSAAWVLSQSLGYPKRFDIWTLLFLLLLAGRVLVVRSASRRAAHS